MFNFKIIVFTTFLLSLASSEESTVLTGVVVWGDITSPYSTIEVLEDGKSHSTDFEGRFQITIKNLKSVTLTFGSIHSDTYSKTVIENIPLSNGEINLGNIPLFINEFIDSVAYNKLKISERKNYSEVSCYGGLIGYSSKNKVDTTFIRTTLEAKKKIKFRLDSALNKVIIRYADWQK